MKKPDSPDAIIESHEKKIREFLVKKPFSRKNISDDAMKLYLEAFTHDSFRNEALDYHIPKEMETYQRLEFFGDSIVEFIVCEHIFSSTDKDQEFMTLYKTEKVANKYISEKAKSNFDFDNLILVGNSFTKEEEISHKMRADVFEAVVAATYISYGMDVTKKIVVDALELGGDE